MQILFVCTGNVCRSPMAEGAMKMLAAKRGLNNITCQSAGTCALSGEKAEKYAVKACKKKGIDISSHRAKQLNAEMLGSADIVFVLTLQQKLEIVKSEVKTGIIYAPSYGIPDPYKCRYGKYKEALKLIIEAVNEFLDKLEKGEFSTEKNV